MKEKNMIIEGIINNNVVSSKDDDGREVVVMGRGIGFGRKKGDALSQDGIEKIFTVGDEESLRKFKDLLAGIPPEYLQVSNEIISYAREKLDVELHPNIYLTLTDHISFAIRRKEEGQVFPIPMENEIRRFYPLEYQIGIHAVTLIEEKLGYLLPVDEAAAVAIHLVNAELNIKVRDTWKITQMMGDILNLVSATFAGFHKEGVEKDGFVTEIKLLSYRLLMVPPMKEKGDEGLLHFVKENYTAEWETAARIGDFVAAEYQCHLTEEETLYFALRIKRMRDLLE